MWSGGAWLNNTQDLYTYQPLTAVHETPPLPNQFALSQNYPNPFNPSTQIRYTVPKSINLSLKVYDVLGREVITLVDGKIEPGEHAVGWNALKNPSGVYFYRFSAGNFVQTKKMTLVR